MKRLIPIFLIFSCRGDYDADDLGLDGSESGASSGMESTETDDGTSDTDTTTSDAESTGDGDG